MKENYQRQLEQILEEVSLWDRTPTLLLHSCCAPCSTYVLDYLSAYFDITVYYYNPNIYPAAEYAFRAQEQEALVQRMETPKPLHFLAAPYEPETFYSLVRGHEGDPERGARCSLCYQMRLEETARRAQEGGFDFFTTTLSISPHKDAARLNAIGRALAERYQVRYLYSDFKKRDGFLRSTQLSARYGIYRQDYCGCLFSYQARQAQEGGDKKVSEGEIGEDK